MALDPAILVSYPHPQVARICLNRPKALNALNVDLLISLVETLRAAQNRARVIILEGAGEKAFCAGEDLKQTLAPKTGSAEELRVSFNYLQDLTRLTSSSSAIVIAAVQGYAIGGGAEIALAADFVIGGPNTAIKFPEASIGHAVTGGISLRLVGMVGLLRAKELLLRGRFVRAEEAHKLGLLTELVDDPKVRALEVAMELINSPAISMASSKLSLERAVFPNMEAVLHDEVNVANYCFAQQEAADTFANFASRKSEAAVAAPNRPSNSAKLESTRSTGTRNGHHHANGVSDVSSKDRDDLLKELRQIGHLNSALRRARTKFPGHTFLRFSGEDITFQAFDSSVARLAGGLLQNRVQRGDRVVVMMRNCLEMVHTWFAVSRIGAVWVPINVELKSITLQHVVQAAAAKLAIIDEEFLVDFKASANFASDSLFIRSVQEHANDFAQLYTQGTPTETSIEMSPSDVCAFLYTSGTTGKSKPCILSHQYFVLQALTLIESFGLVPSDVLYCPFPLFHADATALTTIPALLLGATAALSTRFSASRFWKEIRESRATVYDFMGATLAILYKQPPSPDDTNHNVRLAWGVPIPAFAEDYERRFGHSLYTLYGSVEASIPIMQDISKPLKPGSCGVLRPGQCLRIANDDDEPLPIGTIGNLLLRSDQPNAFFQGYFQAHEQTISAFHNLWFHTGDLARIDEDGDIFFHGRVKDIIRRRGENINASEVEEELLRHHEIVIAAAYAVPAALADGDGTEDDLKVAVVTRAGSTTSEADIWKWAKMNMARFQVPSIIEIVPEIKRTPTGKMEKRWLSSEGGQRFDARCK